MKLSVHSNCKKNARKLKPKIGSTAQVLVRDAKIFRMNMSNGTIEPQLKIITAKVLFHW